MAYQYVAYNTKGEVVKGKLAAANDKEANDMLNYAGYQAISLKPYTPFLNVDSLTDSLSQVKTSEIVLFYRQLAMLLEAGTNMGASIEMLRAQSANRLLRKTLNMVVADIRGGNQLSAALVKHPKIFPQSYCQLLSIGEQGGNLELLLRQVADYMEKEAATVKETKGALTMPAITATVAVVVIGLLIVFVLPSFGKMYSSLGAELPALAKMFISLGEMIRSNGLVILLSAVGLFSVIALYTRTPRGKYQWDKLLLRLPLVGRVKLLSELARYCRSMSLLFHAGMPLSEVMPLVVKSSSNKVLAEALIDVQKEMVKGEGLSGPMSKNRLFLPMMVQMVKVGEETGSLDNTLQAVAVSYEVEVGDKIRTMIGLIQPAMTLLIGGVVALIAITLMSAMTAMYGTL
jgi:type IV pilus assembly protein PilC